MICELLKIAFCLSRDFSLNLFEIVANLVWQLVLLCDLVVGSFSSPSLVSLMSADNEPPPCREIKNWQQSLTSSLAHAESESKRVSRIFRKKFQKFLRPCFGLAWLQITPVPTLESVPTAGGWWVLTRVCMRLCRPAAPAPVVPGSLATLSARFGPAFLAVGHRLAADLDCCREPLA